MRTEAPLEREAVVEQYNSLSRSYRTLPIRNILTAHPRVAQMFVLADEETVGAGG